MKRSILVLLLLATTATAGAGSYTVTAYCHCAKCCGRAGKPAANGKMPVAGVTVAGPRRFPLGTKLNIQGLGVRVVNDRLARRYDNRIDIFMASHKEALQFGIKTLEITLP